MLIDLIRSGVIRESVDLASFTTYKVGGPARWLFDVPDLATLQSLGPYSDPVVVVGRGSNLVVSDHGFAGLVIRLGTGFSDVTIKDGCTVTAGATAPLPSVARACAKAAIQGFSWMVGVPGSVGGAIRMNAGCFGSDTAGFLTEASILNLHNAVLTDRSPETLDYAYRTSNLQPHEVVVGATFIGSPGDPSELEAEMRKVTRWRKDHQPGGTHNAGSVFKNPPGDAAGRVIDELGLKGTRVGRVSVSEKHANFFVAEPGAKAQDIYELVNLVKDAVQQRAGIQLVPEMVFVGFDE